MPDETLRDFHDAELFRIHQPKRVGGAELEFVAVVEFGALLARACASSSWNFINFLSHHLMLGMFPPRAQDEIWGASPDTLIASSFVFPAGKAKKVKGGYVLSGRWPFSSGVDPSEWNMLAGLAWLDDNAPTGARIAEIQSTQIRFGEATAYARASRLVQVANCLEAQKLVVPDAKTKARYRLEGAYAVDWALRAVDVMFALSGAGGLYESGQMPRAFRDAHAVKRHFSFNTDIAGTTYGRVALGLPTDNPTL